MQIRRAPVAAAAVLALCLAANPIAAQAQACDGATRLALAASAARERDLVQAAASGDTTGCSVNELGDLSSSNCPSDQITSNRVVPSDCPVQCAASFAPWWDACGSQPLITMLDVSLGSALSGFGQLCQQVLTDMSTTCNGGGGGGGGNGPAPAPPGPPMVECEDHLNPPCQQVLSSGYACNTDMAQFGASGLLQDFCPVSCRICQEGAPPPAAPSCSVSSRSYKLMCLQASR